MTALFAPPPPSTHYPIHPLPPKRFCPHSPPVRVGFPPPPPNFFFFFFLLVSSGQLRSEVISFLFRLSGPCRLYTKLWKIKDPSFFVTILPPPPPHIHTSDIRRHCEYLVTSWLKIYVQSRAFKKLQKATRVDVWISKVQQIRSLHLHENRCMVKDLINRAPHKNRALAFLRTERQVRIALRAIRNHIALDWTADEMIGKNNEQTFRKTFYLENNFHAKSMAFSSNTLFNATCVKPRLRALSMQKWYTIFVSDKLKREFKIPSNLDGRIFGSRLCFANVKTVYECTLFSR